MTPPSTVSRIESAVAALGDAPLTEAAMQRHVAPLFTRVRETWRDRIYLANHSLGRPLDATEDDVREGLAAWYAHLGGAWDAWLLGLLAVLLGRATRRPTPGR